MLRKNTDFPSLLLLFILLSLFGRQQVFAEIDTPGVLRPSHRAELKVVHDKAENMASQNLNRYALEHLQRYDQLLDSFSTNELVDSLSQLEQEYIRSIGGRKEELTKNHFAIEELTNAKASNLRRYNNLLRKSGIAFGAWFIILIILLQIRKHRLRKQEAVLKDSNIKLQASQKRAELGIKLLDANKTIISHNEKITQASSSLYLSVQKSNSLNPPHSEKAEKVKSLSELSVQLETQVKKELKVCQFLFSLNSVPTAAKVVLDINDVCETALEVAQRGASLGIPAEILLVTKDLEKNLPKISLVPESINALLLNILNNAFQAVKAKHDEGIKGYQPKVILSTRILPRFLQIRIRDNGNGIPKGQLEKIQEEFYSLRTLEDGAGLGLSDSLQLLGEPHKGELRLESDPGNGTDVYIKFYL